MLPRELNYFERVRQRLRNREGYNDLIRCIHMYNVELFSRSELIAMVSDILGGYPDLMSGFTDFLLSCETIELPVPGGPAAALKQKALLVSKDKLLSKPLSEVSLHLTSPHLVFSLMPCCRLFPMRQRGSLHLMSRSLRVIPSLRAVGALALTNLFLMTPLST